MEKDIFLSLIPDTSVAEQIANKILDWGFNGKNKSHMGKTGIFFASILDWDVLGDKLRVMFSVKEDKTQSLETSIGGYYKNKTINVEVSTSLPLSFEGTRQRIYYTLVHVLIHELQHYYQDLWLRKERSYSVGIYSDYDWKYHKSILPFHKKLPPEEYEGIKLIVQVLLGPSEIDAYVTSCYLLAKIQGISFQKVLHETLIRIRSFLFCSFNFLMTKNVRRIYGIIKREFENYAVLKFGG